MIVFLFTTTTTSFRRFTSVQHCAKQLIYIILFNSPKNPIRGRLFFIPLNIHMGFPGRSVVKNLPANAGDVGSIPGSGRFPWRRKWQLTPVFLAWEILWTEEPAGLVHGVTKESDMTEQQQHTQEHTE